MYHICMDFVNVSRHRVYNNIIGVAFLYQLDQFRTIKDGEQALILNNQGRARLVVGPSRLRKATRFLVP